MKKQNNTSDRIRSFRKNENLGSDVQVYFQVATLLLIQDGQRRQFINPATPAVIDDLDTASLRIMTVAFPVIQRPVPDNPTRHQIFPGLRRGATDLYVNRDWEAILRIAHENPESGPNAVLMDRIAGHEFEDALSGIYESGLVDGTLLVSDASERSAYGFKKPSVEQILSMGMGLTYRRAKTRDVPVLLNPDTAEEIKIPYSFYQKAGDLAIDRGDFQIAESLGNFLIPQTNCVRLRNKKTALPQAVIDEKDFWPNYRLEPFSIVTDRAPVIVPSTFQNGERSVRQSFTPFIGVAEADAQVWDVSAADRIFTDFDELTSSVEADETVSVFSAEDLAGIE
jgi:hypothetical protein